MKSLTEAQAWRLIGQAIEKRRGMKHRGTGLCLEMHQLLRAAGFDVPAAVEWSYGNPRILIHVPDGGYAYPDSNTDEWEARCLAAYWLALEAEEEGK